MRVSLKGTNINGKIVRVVEKLLIKPARPAGGDDEPITLDIEVGKTTKHHRTGKIFRAEANLKIGKTMIRAEEEAETLNNAIDEVEYELGREIKKFKERKRALMLKGARRLKGK